MLGNFVPSRKEPLSELNAAVIESKVLMNTAVPLLEKHLCYGDKEDIKLLMVILEEIKENEDFLLLKEDVVYLAIQYALRLPRHREAISIASVLKHRVNKYDPDFITAVLDELSIPEKQRFHAITDLPKPNTKDLSHFFQWKRSSEDDSREHKRSSEDDSREHKRSCTH